MKYNLRRQEEEGEEEGDSDSEIQQLKQKIRLRRQQIRRSRLPPCVAPQHSKHKSMVFDPYFKDEQSSVHIFHIAIFLWIIVKWLKKVLVDLIWKLIFVLVNYFQISFLIPGSVSTPSLFKLTTFNCFNGDATSTDIAPSWVNGHFLY